MCYSEICNSSSYREKLVILEFSSSSGLFITKLYLDGFEGLGIKMAGITG